MKSNLQSIKSSPTKSKKPIKDRDRRKSPGSSETNHNSLDKGSPIKDSSSRLYAGIDSESLSIYAEQSVFEQLSYDVSNTLTEDINYKLRYIINDALIKARLGGRNAISSQDLEETFENLNIDRVYGAVTNPEWLSFGDQNLFYLKDKEVDLIQIVESESVYIQPGDTIITRNWLPDTRDMEKLQNYFKIMCESIISNDQEVRRFALKNISENPRIGPIIEWFYKFAYILLSKDITYDNLTIYALDLINILESHQMTRLNVGERLLKLLVRLLLQRLLKSTIIHEMLQPMCVTLKILCNRIPLREFVIMKITQKFLEIFDTHSLSIVMICCYLGLDAVRLAFLPNMNLFLTKIEQDNDTDLRYSILELYNILSKEQMIDSIIYNNFYEIFNETLILFSPQTNRQHSTIINRKELNFVRTKTMLLKSRRRLSYTCKEKSKKQPTIEEIFEMPKAGTKLYLKLKQTNNNRNNNSDVLKREIIVGKTSLLLPVLKQKTCTSLKCCDHSLISYNF